MDAYPRHLIVTTPAHTHTHTRLHVLLSVLRRFGGFALIVFTRIRMARPAAMGAEGITHLLAPVRTLRRARAQILSLTLIHCL
jgi:hypothetical protein